MGSAGQEELPSLRMPCKAGTCAQTAYFYAQKQAETANLIMEEKLCVFKTTQWRSIRSGGREGF